MKMRIYFATADSARSKTTLRRLLRTGRRGWQVWYDRQICRLVRFLSRSRRAHVCVGIDGAVADPQLRGNFWWPELTFVSTYPTLIEYVEIEAPGRPNEDIMQPRKPRPCLPTVLRWLTRGRTRADDCLTVTLALLLSAGVKVNPRTYTPQQLYDQLAEMDGAKIVRIQDP